jgi:hypothetical protein
MRGIVLLIRQGPYDANHLQVDVTLISLANMDVSSGALQLWHAAQHRTSLVTAVTGVFLALVWSTLLLRLWVRGHLLRGVGWDDWIMVLTSVRLNRSRTLRFTG